MSPQWISVTERLPAEDSNVPLLVWDGEEKAIAIWDGGSFITGGFGFRDISHWMLPSFSATGATATSTKTGAAEVNGKPHIRFKFGGWWCMDSRRDCWPAYGGNSPVEAFGHWSCRDL